MNAAMALSLDIGRGLPLEDVLAWSARDNAESIRQTFVDLSHDKDKVGPAE